MFVYKLTNTNNGKVYIGQTNNLHKRMREHKSSKSDCLISRAIQKHGWDCFDTEVLYEGPEVDSMEIFFIEYYKSRDLSIGYNICEGGKSTRGYRHTESSKEKMRLAKVGKSQTPQSIENRRESLMGRIFTEETRQKISNAMKGNKNFYGKKCSPEHRQKLAEAKAREWQVQTPQGEVVNVVNLRAFCLENNLHPSAMSRVMNGKSPHHKGFRLPSET